MKKFQYPLFLVFILLPIIALTQEEPEAQFKKNKYEFVDSIPYLLVNADRPQWTISKFLNGSHLVYAFENDSLYTDDRIAKWMRDSKTSIIRWPGGTVVQYYHWDDLNGIPFKKDSWAPGYDEEKEPGYKFMDLDEYIVYCRKADTEPLVGLNLRSGKEYNRLEESLDEARRLITYCKEKNYGVKRWYMGNEGYAKGFSAKEYAEYVDRYAKVLKEVDPDIEIIADWKMGPFKKNRFEGTLHIAKESEEIDVMEFHEKWGNVWGLKSGHTLEEWRKEYPTYHGKLGAFIQRFKNAMREAGKDVKTGFNEWGIGTIEGATKFDYAMVAADFLIELFKNDVFQACYWNLNMGEEKSKILNTGSKGTELIGFNPIAEVFTMLADALEKEYLFLDCNEPFIYGFGAKDPKANDIFLYFINKSETETPVNMGVFGLDLENASVTLEEFIDPGTIAGRELDSMDSNTKALMLKPISFNKLKISRK